MRFSRLLIAALLVLCTFNSNAAEVKDYKVIAYYISWGAYGRDYTPAKINAKNLTHINFAFANISHGEVVVGDENVDINTKNNFKQLRQIKTDNPQLKTLISVGGWGWSKEFSNVALTPESRAKFADSALDFVRAHGFDGVDIDWEFPVAGGVEGNSRRPEDKQNYTLLLQALRDKLDVAGKKDKRTYLLTAAIGNNEQFLANTEMDKVAKILDWVNIMAYDFYVASGKVAGHVAPLFIDPAIKPASDSDAMSVSAMVDLTIKAGVPAGKLVLGLPFYGYSWKKCGDKNHGQFQDCQGKGRGSWEDGTIDFSDVDPKLIDKKGFTRYWNDTAKAPYLFNADTGEFITYDDLESFDHKIRFLKEKQLGGAMFWEITGDRDQVLQNKLGKELLGR